MRPGNPQGTPAPGRRLQWLAGAAFLLTAPFLFIGGPDWASGPLLKSAWNFGHIVLFASLTLAVRPWQWFSGWRLWFAVTVALLAAGLVIEVLQYGLDRNMSARDLWRNLIGGWLIIAWQPMIRRRSGATPGNRAMAVLVTLLLCIELGATGVVAARQWQVHHQLPSLYDFRRDNPRPFWAGNLSVSGQYADNGRYSLRIELGTETYSGISLDNLPPDWTGYQRLSLTLFNPAPEPLKLTLRINDVAHDRGSNAYSDRFNASFNLAPGRNTYSWTLDAVANAPETRPMDMTGIRRLGLFAVRLPAPRTVYLLDVRLE